MCEIRVADMIRESIVDGPGIRYVVFAQGCRHHCPDCFNPETHDFEGGRLESVDKMAAEIAKNPLCRGLTCSGGDPMEQPEAFRALAKRVHEMGKDVWAYTGYTWEELLEMGEAVRGFLEEVDVLVDGRFETALRNIDLNYRGSENQRLIDVKKSLMAREVVLWEE